MPLPLPGVPLPIMGAGMGGPPPSTAGTAMKGPRGPAPAQYQQHLASHAHAYLVIRLPLHKAPLRAPDLQMDLNKDSSSAWPADGNDEHVSLPEDSQGTVRAGEVYIQTWCKDKHLPGAHSRAAHDGARRQALNPAEAAAAAGRAPALATIPAIALEAL